MRRYYKSFDYFLMLAVLIMAIIGIIMIGSATHIQVEGAYGDYNKQIVWVIMGIFLLIAASFIDYHFICKFYVLIYTACIMLLIFSLVYNRMTGEKIARWVHIGPIGIQPSEFTKIFMIIFLSKFIDKKGKWINNVPVLCLLLALVALPVMLIYLQPSLSASLVVAAISVTIIFAGNIKAKYVLVAIAILIPLIIFILYDAQLVNHILIDRLLTDYQIGRIKSFVNPELDPDAMYQVKRSIEAIGSGQFGGKGLYTGPLTQSSRLPEARNDFIFAVIGEEFGFKGCFIVLALMLFIILKCVFTALKSADFLGKLIAIGVAAMFAFQTFVNVCVVTGMFPNTGMPFPFLSYGGSSMWICMMAVGLVINVGMTKSKSLFEG